MGFSAGRPNLGRPPASRGSCYRRSTRLTLGDTEPGSFPYTSPWTAGPCERQAVLDGAPREGVTSAAGFSPEPRGLGCRERGGGWMLR